LKPKKAAVVHSGFVKMTLLNDVFIDNILELLNIKGF